MSDRNIEELNRLESLVHKKVITRGGRVVMGYSDLSDTAGASPHSKQHNIDSTDDHVGVSGSTEDNFVSFDANGLPKDSLCNATSFETAGAVSGHESTYDHTLISDKNKKITSWITGDYEILNTDEVVAYEGAGGNSVTLPASTGEGDVYTIKNYSAGTITLVPSGSDNIDSLAGVTLESLVSIIVCDAYAGIWVILSSHKMGSLMTFTEATSSENMIANRGYIINNISTLTMTLPATANAGDVISVVGKGAGGWIVQCNAGQVIHHGDLATISGGSIQSTYFKNTVQLLCITADTDWSIIWTNGNIEVEVS